MRLFGCAFFSASRISLPDIKFKADDFFISLPAVSIKIKLIVDPVPGPGGINEEQRNQ